MRPNEVELPIKLNLTALGLARVDGLEKAYALLRDIYGVLWTEAYYDPSNEHTGRFARPLADKMTEANKLLGFKP